MLVKYLGTILNTEGHTYARSDFLENGLFRITQPKYLNDKGSEARFYPYFEEFSPADIEYARKCFRQFNVGNTEYPSNDELIKLHLEPAGRRYSIEEFPTLLAFTDYISVEDYRRAVKQQLYDTVEKFNKFIVEALSCHIGVFSLSKRIDNDQMWTHYASEGRGVALSFKETHSFFHTFKPMEVSYNKSDRASITCYKGDIRINGEYAKSYEIREQFEFKDFFKLYLENKMKYEELFKKLLFTKAPQWMHEMESRIVIPLNYSDKKLQNLIEPDFEDKIPEHFSSVFPKYSEVCLKKIPFDAFDTLFFGYAMSEKDKERIIKLIKSNENLQHLQVKQMYYNIYGSLEFENINLN